MRCKTSRHIPSFLKEYKTAQLKYELCLSFPLSHVYAELGGGSFYCQFRLKRKQTNKKKHVSVHPLMRLSCILPFCLHTCTNISGHSSRAASTPVRLSPQLPLVSSPYARWKTCLYVSLPSIKVFCCCKESAPLIYAGQW